MIPKSALIFGITGQDGAYLAKFLLQRGYAVFGTSRDKSGKMSNLQHLQIDDKVQVHIVSVADSEEVREVVKYIHPSEIYYLAGQAQVSVSFAKPVEAFSSITIGTINVLEAIRSHCPDTKFYLASSSEIFGNNITPSSEETPFRPVTPYGAAKAAATNIVDIYRNAYGIFACSGIMFSHESPLRPENYVVKRIINGTIDIVEKRRNHLYLGNCSIVRDWGWAPEFVECFWKILQQETPQDFVIATGVGTSLETFIDRIFSRFQLNWKDFVEIDRTLVRPTDIQVSFGNPTKAELQLGWKAQVRMPEVADRLIDAALKNHKG